jgi:hypothetical protein
MTWPRPRGDQRARWSAVIPVVALVAVGSLVVLQRVGEDHSVVRVRPQSARHSFIVHGLGRLRRPTRAVREDARQIAAQSGASVAGTIRSLATQSRFDRITDRFVVGFVVAGHAEPGAGYAYWALFTTKPPAAELAPLTRLPVDVQVRYGDTIGTYASQTLGDLMIGELGRHLTLGPVESDFNDDYDAVRLTYRPPAGADADELASAEHAALADLAAAEPDGMLPFPVEFVRDPTLRPLTGDSQ